MFEVSLILLLAWGALAFGAEYAWAYAPLLVFSLVPAIIGLRASRGSLPSRAMLITLAALAIAVVLQIVTPAHVVPERLQAGAPGVDFESHYAQVIIRPSFEAGGPARLSIAPGRTLLGLAFLASFALLLAGCTRAVSALGHRRLVGGLLVLGVVVAFVGTIQSVVRAETTYGFWRPSRSGVHLAPFLNENHFSGWMAMTLSLAIGALAGDFTAALKHVAGWRDRILWFSTPRASIMILTVFAVSVMALSMVLSQSRGGLVGLLVLFLVGAFWLMRRLSGQRRRAGGIVFAVILVFAAIWGGAERTIEQFRGAAETVGGRKEVWRDTWRIVEDYPLTGTGLNTYGVAMLHYQTATPGWAAVEAHNDYLQLAAEGGLLLGIPILLAIGVFVREVWRRFAEAADDAETYWVRAGAVTGLCAIAVMEIFDFTLQMPGAAAMFVVLAAIAMHKPNHVRPVRSSARGEGRRA